MDGDLFSGNDGLLFHRNLTCEPFTQSLYEGRYLDAEASIVVSISEVRLRKTGGDDQRNAFCFNAGDSLFAA